MKRVLCAPLPSWKQIVQNKNEDCMPYYGGDAMYLAESCMSIALIIRAAKVILKKEAISVWLPDYFCDDTINAFYDDNIKLTFYPINEELEPAWTLLRECAKSMQPDIFIFVHYFGKYRKSVGDAKEFCRLHKTVLIEDCAHVLYGTGKIGRFGDFVLYSPHKQLPIPDGSVLCLNENRQNENVLNIQNEVRNEYGKLEVHGDDGKWYVKKSIQKILPVKSRITYFHGIHYGAGGTGYHKPCKISRKSLRLLSGYSYTDLKRAAFLRRENLEVMNYIMSIRFPKLMPQIDSTTDVPYLAVYSIENEGDKVLMEQELLKRNFVPMFWPDLPVQLKKHNTDFSIAEKLSKNIITFPIHQGIRPQQLIKKYLGVVHDEDCHIEFKKADKDIYQSIYSRCEVNNMLQDWRYGDAKHSTEGWKAVRYIIIIDGSEAGVMQVLVKVKAAVVEAYRINRGPVMKQEYDDALTKFAVVGAFKKSKHIHVPIFYAPNVEITPENLHIATSYGWRCRDEVGFPSAIIDLSQDEHKMYEGLKHFWKKNLKHARKQVTIRYNEYEICDIIDSYMNFMKEKNISGIPRHILEYLFSLSDCPLEVLTAHNAVGERIAYKVLYKHGNCGTSFIMTNTEEGRAKQARTLLIWESMVRLKELGYRYFDLGGVEDIYVEDVAKFKRGAGGTEYRLLGEFISV